MGIAVTQKQNLPNFWIIRRLRRWIIKPQKEVDRWKRRWRSSPLITLPKFLKECKQFLVLLEQLNPDIVLGNERSGSPYVKALEHHLQQKGITVRYERLCSSWGHKLSRSIKPASSVHWLYEALACGKRIVMVDVSRKPFSDAQRIVSGVIVWLYNEAVSQIIGKPQPFELVSGLDKTMRAYLQKQTSLPEAVNEILSVIQNLSISSHNFASQILLRNRNQFVWNKTNSSNACMLSVNVSREAWIDDRTDKYSWLPTIARRFLSINFLGGRIMTPIM